MLTVTDGVAALGLSCLLRKTFSNYSFFIANLQCAIKPRLALCAARGFKHEKVPLLYHKIAAQMHLNNSIRLRESVRDAGRCVLYAPPHLLTLAFPQTVIYKFAVEKGEKHAIGSFGLAKWPSFNAVTLHDCQF